MNFKNSVQFSSVTHSCLTLCNPLNCSTPDFPVHHQLLELAQTDIHPVDDAIQTYHPLSSHSPPASNLFQHQELFQWVSSSHQVVSCTIRASYVLGEMHTCFAVTLAKVFQFYFFFFLKNNNKLSRRFIIGDFSMECPRWSW